MNDLLFLSKISFDEEALIFICDFLHYNLGTSDSLSSSVAVI